MTDQADKDAEALLPCVIPRQPCMDHWPDREKCNFCFVRAAVATALRKLYHDIHVYRGYLGYPVPGDLENANRLSDGTEPKNGIAQALESQLAQANQEIDHQRADYEQLKADREWTRQLLNEQRNENWRIYDEKEHLRAELAALKGKVK